MPNLHPKVVAGGAGGALAIVLAEVGDQLGFHPRSPAFYTAVGSLLVLLPAYLKKGK